MIWTIACLVAVGVCAGPVLAELRCAWLRRLLGWSVLVAVIAGADFFLNDNDAIARMVGVCCVLLGAMKGLVYAEWAGTRKLPLARYAVFSFLWFGMDPASFLKRREGLGWKSDIVMGTGLMLVGTLSAWLVWMMGWRQILIMFMPMSVGFHFGALRVLKGLLRACGFPVRTLFPNVLATEGLGDFWSRRWNVGYSQMMQRVVGRPVGSLAGANTGVMAVFVVSGLLHELAITLPVRAGFGLPTLYFTLHGGLTLLEGKLGRRFGRIPALLAVVLPLGLLFPAPFQDGVIARCFEVFDFLERMIKH